MSYTCLKTGKPIATCNHCRGRGTCAGVDLYYADKVGRWVVVDAGKLSVGKTREQAVGKALWRRAPRG